MAIHFNQKRIKNALQNVSVRFKLFLIMGTLSLGMIIIGICALVSSLSFGGTLNKVIHMQFGQAVLSKELATNINNINSILGKIVDASSVESVAASATEIETGLKKFKKNIDDLTRFESNKVLTGMSDKMDKTFASLIDAKKNQIKAEAEVDSCDSQVNQLIEDSLTSLFTLGDNFEIEVFTKAEQIRKARGAALGKSVDELLENVYSPIKNMYSMRILLVQLRAKTQELKAAENAAFLGSISEEIDSLMGKMKTQSDDIVKNVSDSKAQSVRDNVDKLSSIITDSYIAQKTQALQAHDVFDNSIAEKDSLVSESMVEIQKIIAKSGSKTDEIKRKTSRQIVFISLVILVVFVISMLVSILIGSVVIGNILNSLKSMIVTLKDLASGDGDLTKELEVQSQDEFGEMSVTINLFISRIRTMIQTLITISNEVISVAQDLKGTKTNLLMKSDESTSLINSVSSAMIEFSSSITQVGQATKNSSQYAITTRDVAIQSGEGIRMLINNIQKMGMMIQDAAVKQSELVDQNKKVAATIKSINDISDQTNLLALNATIESARAGEHGRGFAVVADEVRKLARKTNNAAVDILQMLESIKTLSNSASEAMHVVKLDAEYGLKISGEADCSLQKIQETVEELAEGISMVAVSVDEQTSVSQGIANNMDNINLLSKGVLDETFSLDRLFNRLDASVDQLKSITLKFKL